MNEDKGGDHARIRCTFPFVTIGTGYKELSVRDGLDINNVIEWDTEIL